MGQTASMDLVCCAPKRQKSAAKNISSKVRLQQHQPQVMRNEDSDTHSDESDHGKNQILRIFSLQTAIDEEEPEPENSVTLSELSIPMGPQLSVFEEVQQQEMEACKERLSKNIWKYPTGGQTLFNSGSKKYFAVANISSEERRNRLERCRLEQPCLCYWADENKSQTEDPDGYWPIASIRGEVLRPTEKCVLEIKIKTKSPSKDRVECESPRRRKDRGEVSLLLKFETNEEAVEWKQDLRLYVNYVRKNGSGDADSMDMGRTMSHAMSHTMSHMNSLSPAKRSSPKRR
jgi:hypothetical protein|mmetsp:Transcript_2549/g.4368  ORF Transcript_2549/g.4368 Transcript_2549/m.4368 type:complete len:289 (-) Transcript_2549:99-965(-)